MYDGQAAKLKRLRRALAERLELIQVLREFLATADGIVTLPATGEAPATLTSTGDPLVGKPLADMELLATAQWCAAPLGGGFGPPIAG